jgi:hypothetical protein
VYGQDLFRTGGDDYGRGDAIFGGIYLGIVAWCVVLLALGVRTVQGWTWARAAAAVCARRGVPDPHRSGVDALGASSNARRSSSGI